jgi:hypothetical protein
MAAREDTAKPSVRPRRVRGLVRGQVRARWRQGDARRAHGAMLRGAGSQRRGFGRAVADMCSNHAIAGLAHQPAAASPADAAVAGKTGGAGAVQGGEGGAAGRGAEGARLVLEHRKLSALLNCHVKSLLSFCHKGGASQLPARDAAMGAAPGEAVCRVHPLQVQMGCATGRVGTR